MGTPTQLLTKPGLLKGLLSQARLAARLIREPTVPVVTKMVPALGFLYLVSPIDFVPDLLPVLGQLDDIGIVLAAMELFLHLCPAAPAAYHRNALAAGRPFSPMPGDGQSIDAEFRRE
jgi:uncharacterized membrane protein YkvA (DUF1232 family)